MKLSLEAKQLGPGMDLPLQVQSISPSGLAVLTTDEAPSGLEKSLLADQEQVNGPLTFVLEKDGRSTTLQASLLWLEFTSEQPAGRRLELIVDTGDEPGWWEVHAALAGE